MVALNDRESGKLMRRIPLSRRSHVTGFQPLDGEAIEHESALERDFVMLAQFADAGATVRSQPITIRFDAEGQSRRYTPDFHVAWSDGRSELVEIKYRADLRAQWQRLRPAFAAARRVAVQDGGRFRIVTESGIRGPLLDHARRLLPLRGAPLDTAVAEQAMMAARSLAEPTFGAIVSAASQDRVQALGAVWRLLARGALVADLSRPVAFDTVVRAS
ncbi:TnsA endonuclease-like protein [Aquabacter spiritensis]|uniref:TnsA endonuclease-like protein n=1 Tax=Aquabacter spiritensis TaxID=933073 RepID=A0A4V6NZE5_9HYPH|nr:TnsA endonuclease-like protein [Aquabacter spiritensis]